MGDILEGWSTSTSTSASRVARALRTECQERLFGRRSPSSRSGSSCWKKVRKRPQSLGLVQRSPQRGGAHVVALSMSVLVAGSRRPTRPSSSYSSRSRWRSTWCQRRREHRREAEGVGVARERCLAPWAGELGAGVRCGMRASVGYVFARSMLGLRCPAPPCAKRRKGPGGSDRRCGVLRAQNEKCVLADV